MRMKKRTAILIAMLLCFGVVCGAHAGEAKAVRIGSKDFTENMIIAEVYALALEDAGFTVERMMGIAGSLVHEAITNDEIDLYPEYTGTGLLTILKMDMMTDPQQVYDTVKSAYDKQFGITWLDQTQANDGQGLVIRTQVAQDRGITTISDLQAQASSLRFASQGEFDQRDDGLPRLEAIYGPFDFASSKVYDNGLKYQILLNDEADVAPAYTTEGPLTDTGSFTLLADDKQAWPPYYLAPIVRNNVLTAYPQIANILNRVSATLDTQTVTALNAQVDVDKLEYQEVAEAYYQSIK